MSTRCAIARPHAEHLFEGVYSHWDGYPSGVGETIHKAQQFFGSPALLAQYLIDDHPAGWSSLMGRDFTKPPSASTHIGGHPNAVCRTCKQAQWRHYVQNYKAKGFPTPPKFRDDSYLTFDHTFDPFPDPMVDAPCPYPDSEKSDTPLRGDGDDWGAEYAYVIAVEGLAVYDRCWNEGGKMIGMFGSGADAGLGRWRHVTTVAWNDHFDGAKIETDIRMYHELGKVASDAGLGDI